MAAKNNNDISIAPVIRPQGGQDMALELLPTRGEKMLIPSPVTVTQESQIMTQGFSKGQPTTFEYPLSVSQLQDDFNLSAALEPLTDFVVIYIQNRVVNGVIDHQGGNPASTSAVFRFLINPATISIAHSTLQSENFDRSGWQFGVWGEDMVRVSLSGKTPGQFFSLGLTDEFAEYSKSYQNLEQIQAIYENNGYWFEGESVNYGEATSNFTRRIIKMHNDVILAVKEFIWYGMFEAFEYSQDAENPYLANWSLSFIAWKEQFRSDSPYYNALPNNVQRGNAYSVFSALVNPSPSVTPLSVTNDSGQPQTLPPQPPGNTTATSPVQQSNAIAYPTVHPSGVDYSNAPSVIMGADTNFKDFLEGIL
jgi:hypothetical protein